MSTKRNNLIAIEGERSSTCFSSEMRCEQIAFAIQSKLSEHYQLPLDDQLSDEHQMKIIIRSQFKIDEIQSIVDHCPYFHNGQQVINWILTLTLKNQYGYPPKVSQIVKNALDYNAFEWKTSQIASSQYQHWIQFNGYKHLRLKQQITKSRFIRRTGQPNSTLSQLPQRIIDYNSDPIFKYLPPLIPIDDLENVNQHQQQHPDPHHQFYFDPLLNCNSSSTTLEQQFSSDDNDHNHSDDDLMSINSPSSSLVQQFLQSDDDSESDFDCGPELPPDIQSDDDHGPDRYYLQSSSIKLSNHDVHSYFQLHQHNHVHVHHLVISGHSKQIGSLLHSARFVLNDLGIDDYKITDFRFNFPPHGLLPYDIGDLFSISSNNHSLDQFMLRFSTFYNNSL